MSEPAYGFGAAEYGTGLRSGLPRAMKHFAPHLLLQPLLGTANHLSRSNVISRGISGITAWKLDCLPNVVEQTPRLRTYFSAFPRLRSHILAGLAALYTIAGQRFRPPWRLELGALLILTVGARFCRLYEPFP